MEKLQPKRRGLKKIITTELIKIKNVNSVIATGGGAYIDDRSHRLINKKDQNCGFSFHITTYEPHFDTIVEGDGIHEVVLYCLHGSSKQIDLSDNREHNFSIGDAIYLPLNFRYRHIIGDGGLVVAVCVASLSYQQIDISFAGINLKRGSDAIMGLQLGLDLSLIHI